MIGRFDKTLRADAAFRRYNSLSEAGIDLSTWALTNPDRLRKQIEEYKNKILRIMLPQFKVPAYVRAEVGHIVNTDEAMDGVAECFRRKNLKARAPLRIGINMSRDYFSSDIVAIRGGAILAFYQLCKSRGQNVELEIAYGNGKHASSAGLCHVRINIQNPSLESLVRICCSEDGITSVGRTCVAPLAQSVISDGRWMGYYRFKEFSWKEYDFVLDRIETSDPKVEYDRVMKQLEKFKLT